MEASKYSKMINIVEEGSGPDQLKWRGGGGEKGKSEFVICFYYHF